jgi:hypothetical protein
MGTGALKYFLGFVDPQPPGVVLTADCGWFKVCGGKGVPKGLSRRDHRVSTESVHVHSYSAWVGLD